MAVAGDNRAGVCGTPISPSHAGRNGPMAETVKSSRGVMFLSRLSRYCRMLLYPKTYVSLSLAYRKIVNLFPPARIERISLL
jgi:hypothetical protein